MDGRQIRMWGPTAMSFAVGRSLSYTDQPHSTGSDVTATYTFDVFCSLDGYGSYGPGGDWGGYWGKQGPELLGHRLASFGHEQRMVFGATTFRQFVQMLAESTEESEVRDPWVTRMRNMPATVVSSRAVTPSTSSPGSRRSPRCRCARTAACR
jgi:hypothetical protein